MTTDHPRRTRPASGTPERILATAERLFAERGIEAVSVRAILAEAGVNVAMAHRHFGSRAGLIDELLRRAIGPLNRERLRLLDAADARGSAASLEDVLRAMFAPAVRWIVESPDRARLLARVQTSADPAIHRVHGEHFRELVERFGRAVRRRVSRDVAPAGLVYRLYFALGAGLVASLQWPRLARAVRELGAGTGLDERDVTDEMVVFCAAGLRAASPRRRLRGRPAEGARSGGAGRAARPGRSGPRRRRA